MTIIFIIRITIILIIILCDFISMACIAPFIPVMQLKECTKGFT